MIRRRGIFKKGVALLLAGVMLCGEGTAFGSLGGGLGAERVMAAEADDKETVEVTSMVYWPGGNDGPDLTRDAVTDTTFGFVAPKFNGKEYKDLDLAAVWDDLVVEEKQEDGTWKDIDKKYNSDSPYQWNVDWAFCLGDNWDNYVFWFRLEKTTNLRIRSVSHPDVFLEYHLNVNKLEKENITSISSTETTMNTDPTGLAEINFANLTINGKKLTSFTNYQQYEDDLEMLVDNKDGKGFVALSANPDSKFMWGDNFTMWYDGAGGMKLTTDWSYIVRFRSKSNTSVYHDFTINYNEPVRSSYKLSTTGSADAIQTELNAINANHTASTGLVLPYIDGTRPYKRDLEKFVYQIEVDGQWVDLAVPAESGWVYQGNGYSKYSDKSQWGYFVDHVYGLWFQPVLKDTKIRVGYPENNEKGGAINDNWIVYNIKGDPDGFVPDVADMVDIDVDQSDDAPKGDVSDDEIQVPEGWQMIWHDEFNGNALDDTKWANQTGYILDLDDITTAGWGNNEDEWYSDSPKNTSVHDGMLNLTMVPEEKTFTANDGQTATAKYSSGKVISQNKFSVKYGRVDFRAKLPAGTGIWPAMWMMPNDDVYGTWAASGEIDVFEGKGRSPQQAYGTLHYGGQSPGNKNTGDFIDMVANGNKKSDYTNWHVYSLVWEEGNLKVYADGKCYFKCTSETFFSVNGNENAPFDQRFYLIMNLAAGGWFDGGVKPGADFERADMYVDYVRVYQKKVADGEDEKNDDQRDGEEKWKTNGVDDGLYGDYKAVATATTDKVSYTVEHYQQNTAQDDYELADTKDYTGEAGAKVNATAEKYEGFTYNEKSSTASGTLEKGSQLVLKLYYDRNEYDVEYVEAGDDNTNVTKYVYGDEVTLKEPRRTGYTFMGWYSDENKTKKVSKLTDALIDENTSKITLYADWLDDNDETTAKYVVNVYAQKTSQDGYNLLQKVTGIGTVGEEVSAKDIVSGEDIDLTGFELNEDAEGTVLSGTIKDDNSLELALYYDRKTYTITYEMNGGTNSSENASSYVYGVGMDLATPQEREDYEFAGWYEDDKYTKGIAAIDSERAEDLTIYAKWEEKIPPELPTHQIAYVFNAPISDTEREKFIGYYKEGIGLTLETPTCEGRTFEGWYETIDFQADSKITEIPADATKNYLLFAKWSKNKYTVNFEPGILGLDPWTEELAEGDKIEPLEGGSENEFLGWYTTKECEDGTDVTVVPALPNGETEITLYAKWKQTDNKEDDVTYTVTFNSNGGTAVASQTVNEGEKAVEPAKPTRANYDFLGWYLMGTSLYNFNQPVNADIILIAMWKQKTAQPTPQPTPQPDVYAGLVFPLGKLQYVVISADANNMQVGVIQPLNKKEKKITIPATVTYKGKTLKVTAIANNAFKNNKKLTSVTIGSNVLSIGSQTFSGCKKLTKVTIGKNVKSIGKKAFYNCKKLKLVKFKGKKAPKIGSKAFTKTKSSIVFRTGNKKTVAKYRKALKKKMPATGIVRK